MAETQKEYMNSLFTLLMGDKKYPEFGYRPIQIKERIDDLLEKENQLKTKKDITQFEEFLLFFDKMGIEYTTKFVDHNNISLINVGMLFIFEFRTVDGKLVEYYSLD